MRLKQTSTSASTPTYQSVSRTRTESSIQFRPPRREDVAGPAPRVQQFRREAVVHLAAQALHVHLYEVGEEVEVLVPDVLGYVAARDDLPGAAREVFEQRVLLRRQVNAAPVAHDPL